MWIKEGNRIFGIKLDLIELDLIGIKSQNMAHLAYLHIHTHTLYG